MSTKQSILLALAILALFSMSLFIVFGENGLADLHLLRVERDRLLKKNAEITQENLSLYREIERLKHDLDFLENVARKELGVVGKDELIFKLKKRGKEKIE
jgi:cell division protein FtsB